MNHNGNDNHSVLFIVHVIWHLVQGSLILSHNELPILVFPIPPHRCVAMDDKRILSGSFDK